MKPKPQTEKEITASIRTLLKAFGIFHYKNWQGLGSQKGVSDIVGIYKGKFLAIEVKTEKGKLNDHQSKFLILVKQNGGIAIVARSVHDVFKGLGLERKSNA